MFHPGKVLAVLKSDEKSVIGVDQSVQVLVSMWDENLLTVEIEPSIASKVRENDIVLIDYSPKYTTIPVPRQVAVKILRGEIAKKIWSEYTQKNQKRKSETESIDSDRLPPAGFHIR